MAHGAGTARAVRFLTSNEKAYLTMHVVRSREAGEGFIIVNAFDFLEDTQSTSEM